MISSHEALKAYLREKQDMYVIESVARVSEGPGFILLNVRCKPKMWYRILRPGLRYFGTLTVHEPFPTCQNESKYTDYTFTLEYPNKEEEHAPIPPRSRLHT